MENIVINETLDGPLLITLKTLFSRCNRWQNKVYAIRNTGSQFLFQNTSHYVSLNILKLT